MQRWRANPLSRPLLAECFEARLSQVIRAHQNAKFAAGLEVEKKRLGKRGHIGRSPDVNNEYFSALAFLFGEVGCLGLDGFKNMLNDLTGRSALVPAESASGRSLPA